METELDWPTGYVCRRGSGLDRALLLKFMRRTFRELHTQDGEGQDFEHLSDTVSRYLSEKTPLWFVEVDSEETSEVGVGLPRQRATFGQRAIACLWMGTAIAQETGDSHATIFLVYVDPQHRRQGLGERLMVCGEAWAQARGDGQITLQVFANNHPALRLYERLGYQVQSYWMSKPLS